MEARVGWGWAMPRMETAAVGRPLVRNRHSCGAGMQTHVTNELASIDACIDACLPYMHATIYICIV